MFSKSKYRYIFYRNDRVEPIARGASMRLNKRRCLEISQITHKDSRMACTCNIARSTAFPFVWLLLGTALI